MSQVLVGIVGLPNSGKSTLFNALLKRQIAQVAEYPYTTVEPNVGVVEVPDKRLDQIADVLKISKKVPAAIEFIDIAGLVKGAHQGEGLGNQFLAKIREVDAILHVIRAFENPQVTHVHGKIDPEEDVRTVEMELELGGIKKPTIYALNVSEKDLKNESMNRFIGVISVIHKAPAIVVCAKLEAELSDLSALEQKEYLEELGVSKSGLNQIIQESYKLLDLITFFTVAGGKQAQAWPIKVGTKAIEASGKVHTEMARGFIAADVLGWERLVEAGSWQKAKELGLVKIAGRNEVITDGMVIEFKFSV